MARPQAHPKTGVYWLRVRIPANVREAFGGKTEYKRSLGTKDPAEARLLFGPLYAEFMDRLASHRAAKLHLDREQAAACAQRWRHWFIARHRQSAVDFTPADGTPEPGPWGIALELYTDLVPDWDPNDTDPPPPENHRSRKRREAFMWDTGELEAFLHEEGLNLSDASRTTLLHFLTPVMPTAFHRLSRLEQDDFTPDPQPLPTAARPQPQQQHQTATRTNGDSFGVWVRGYQACNGAKPSTAKRYASSLASLTAFVGDVKPATAITKSDIAQWKDQRLKDGVTPYNIKNVDLAAARAVFKWAISNGKTEINPAVGVDVEGAKRRRTALDSDEDDDGRGFSDSEAEAILTACLSRQPSSKEAAHNAAARKWAPWLCAFTGARMSEMGQLRKEDVRDGDGGPYVLITPEAGTVKTDTDRRVPLHPQLIAMGFLDFVAKAPAGPLFSNKLGGGGNARDKVRQWVRSLPIDLRPGLSPNHAWRHRHTTLLRLHGVPDDVVDAVQGRAIGRGRSAGGYGKVPLALRAQHIARLPWYRVPGAPLPPDPQGSRIPDKG